MAEEARIAETLKGSGERKFRGKIRAEKLKVRWMEARVERLEKAKGAGRHFSEKGAILAKAMQKQMGICVALKTAAVQAKEIFGETSKKADSFAIMYYEAVKKYAELCGRAKRNVMEAMGVIIQICGKKEEHEG